MSIVESISKTVEVPYFEVLLDARAMTVEDTGNLVL